MGHGMVVQGLRNMAAARAKQTASRPSSMNALATAKGHDRAISISSSRRVFAQGVSVCDETGVARGIATDVAVAGFADSLAGAGLGGLTPNRSPYVFHKPGPLPNSCLKQRKNSCG
jgi:hypothetical protein